MRPKRVIKAVLFDLDGTLLDSAPDLVATLNHLRAGLGLDAMPLDDLRHFVSRGAPGLIKAGMPPCDDETLAIWRASFVEHYQENSYIHSRPFDGVESMLSELAGRKIPWGIVTSKVEFLTLPILEKTGWLSSATTVICGDTASKRKPHAEPVLEACNRIGIDPAETLMVGDDLRDVEAGRAAGTHTVFVLYGYTDQESLPETARDTVFINTPGEVLSLLNTTGSV